jgi:hypothetical protein
MRIKAAGSKKRPRIQFYLTPELEKLLEANRTMARKCGVRIDFQVAFLAWFTSQNREARTALEKLVKERSSNAAETD